MFIAITVTGILTALVKRELGQFCWSTVDWTMCGQSIPPNHPDPQADQILMGQLSGEGCA